MLRGLLNCTYLQLKLAGTMCRESSNSCDLPEFCTGSSPHCPANVYLHDGHACHNVDGYCYNGICQTHEQQCITLWGPGEANAAKEVGLCSVEWSVSFTFGDCFRLQELNLLLGSALRESTLQGILMGTVGKTPEVPLPNVMQGRIMLLHWLSEARE